MTLVDDAGRGGDQIEVELALQPLLNDLHVQKAQEAAAEAVAQGHGGLRLEGQGRVVQPQLLQRVAQSLVVRAVGGIDAAVDHGQHRLVAGQRLWRRALSALVMVSPTRMSAMSLMEAAI